MNNENIVVLITGGSAGIGKETCKYLSSRGFIVFGTCRKSIPADDSQAYDVLQLDIGNSQSVKHCVKKVIDKTGRIDVLINNAAYSRCGSLVNIPPEDLIDQYNVNVFGTMRMIQSVIPHMLEQGNGRIINIGSIGGRIPLPFQAAYSSSKAVLMNMTDSLKIELLRDGIKVCLVEPGDTRTNFRINRLYTSNLESDIPAKPSIEIMEKSEKEGVSPFKVAKTIYKAIISDDPRQRYIVGPDATLLNFINRLLPPRLRRKIIMGLYKIPGIPQKGKQE